MMRRSGGFDVPDILAAGPRDVLVPASGAAAAREALLQEALPVVGVRPPGAAAAPGTAAGRAASTGSWSPSWPSSRSWPSSPGSGWSSSASGPAWRARCARQVPSVCASGRPPNAATSALRGPARGTGSRSSRPTAAQPSSRASRSRTRAAEQRRVGEPGREVRGRPFAQPAHDGAARVLDLAATASWPAPACSQAQRPVAGAATAGRNGGGRRGLAAPTDELHVERRGRQQLQLARARDVGGAPLEDPRGEHVDLVAAEPARRRSGARRAR